MEEEEEEWERGRERRRRERIWKKGRFRKRAIDNEEGRREERFRRRCGKSVKACLKGWSLVRDFTNMPSACPLLVSCHLSEFTMLVTVIRSYYSLRTF